MVYGDKKEIQIGLTLADKIQENMDLTKAEVEKIAKNLPLLRKSDISHGKNLL